MFEITGLAGFIILALLGFYVIFKNKGQSINIVLSLWLLSTSVWSLGQVLMIVSQNAEELIIPIQISFMAIFLMGSTTLHIALNYPSKRKIMKHKSMPLLLYLPFIIFGFILFTNNVHFLFLEAVSYNPNTILHHSIRYGLVGSLGKIVPYLFVFISVISLIHSSIQHKGRVRIGSLLLSFGLFSGIFSSVLSEFQIMPATTLFPISGLLFALAIIKYRTLFVTPSTAAENILKTMNDGLIITDVKNNILKINNSVTSMLGFTEKDLYTKHISLLFNDNNFMFQSIDFQRMQPGKLINSHVETVSKKNGDKLYGSINVSSIQDDSSKVVGYVYNIRNVTKEKRDEQRLKESKKTLEETIKKLKKRTEEVESLLNQKDELFHLLAHDLKNPLTTPRSVLPIVEKKVTDEKIKKMLKISIKNINTIQRIIDETLKLARYEDFSALNDQKELLINDLVGKVLDSNQGIIKKNHFHVETAIDETLSVFADEFQMEELLNNLISNAIKYTPNDVSGLIKIEAKKEKDTIIFSVRDNGIGLVDSQKERVFEKFYKAGSPRDGMDSTGLGLGICKNIVARHGGDIWVKSDGPGTGSTFYVQMPVNSEKHYDGNGGNIESHSIEREIDDLLSEK